MSRGQAGGGLAKVCLTFSPCKTCGPRCWGSVCSGRLAEWHQSTLQSATALQARHACVTAAEDLLGIDGLLIKWTGNNSYFFLQLLFSSPFSVPVRFVFSLHLLLFLLSLCHFPPPLSSIFMFFHLLPVHVIYLSLHHLSLSLWPFRLVLFIPPSSQTPTVLLRHHDHHCTGNQGEGQGGVIVVCGFGG